MPWTASWAAIARRRAGVIFPDGRIGAARIENTKKVEAEVARLKECEEVASNAYADMRKQCDKWQDEAQRLLARLEEAPHDPSCATVQWPGEDDDHCDCWQAEVGK